MNGERITFALGTKLSLYGRNVHIPSVQEWSTNAGVLKEPQIQFVSLGQHGIGRNTHFPVPLIMDRVRGDCGQGVAPRRGESCKSYFVSLSLFSCSSGTWLGVSHEPAKVGREWLGRLKQASSMRTSNLAPRVNAGASQMCRCSGKFVHRLVQSSGGILAFMTTGGACQHSRRVLDIYTKGMPCIIFERETKGQWSSVGGRAERAILPPKQAVDQSLESKLVNTFTWSFIDQVKIPCHWGHRSFFSKET